MRVVVRQQFSRRITDVNSYLAPYPEPGVGYTPPDTAFQGPAPPWRLSDWKLFQGAIIELESAIRAANSCNYEQLVHSLFLAESQYQNSKFDYMRKRGAGDDAPGGVDQSAYGREIQRYLDATSIVGRDTIPRALKGCGCR